MIEQTAPVPCESDHAADRGALVLRGALGLVFVAHALYKVALSFPVAAGFFEAHGFPGWTVYPVFVAELAGGLALVAGVAVRATAAVLAVVVLGALRVHAGNGWYFAAPDGGWEYLAVLLAGLASLVLLGPRGPRLAIRRRTGTGAGPGRGAH